jgi:hypothetical protein
MGKRSTIYGSLHSVSARPRISVFHVGCFMRMMRDPSRRTTCLASTRVHDKHAPKKVRIRKPAYVLLPMGLPSVPVLLTFKPRVTCFQSLVHTWLCVVRGAVLTTLPITAPRLKISQKRAIYRPLSCSGGYDIIIAPCAAHKIPAQHPRKTPAKTT